MPKRTSIADKGALATRAGSKYEFFIAGHDKKAAPGLVTLVSYVVEHLDRQDPVLGLMRLDEKYRSLGDLRLAANKLFSTVMAPQLAPDAANRALELVEPRPAPEDDDPAPELVSASTKGGS